MKRTCIDCGEDFDLPQGFTGTVSEDVCLGCLENQYETQGFLAWLRRAEEDHDQRCGAAVYDTPCMGDMQ